MIRAGVGLLAFVVILLSLESVTAFADLSQKAYAHATRMKTSTTHLPCADCKKLADLITEARKENEKQRPHLAPLIAKASAVIEHMNSSGRLMPEQLQSLVEALRVFVPSDPGRSILENTIDVIQKNRAALEAALKHLPISESKILLDSVAVALAADSEGPDTAP
jgi:hypothetical protein